ncbi:hypothetical protein EK904_002174 [Melospiza melodia maxima]|nr:hypothetical protein EK904_002174 [Melospiza melodia maxima]
MLCLLGVMLSVLCLVSPAPHSTVKPCPTSDLFKETIKDLRVLSSKGSSEIMLRTNTMEAGGNAATYLEGFIEALKNSKESVEHILVKLKDIQAYGESCTGWMSTLKERPWKTLEGFDFFENLDEFLRLLGENAKPQDTN